MWETQPAAFAEARAMRVKLMLFGTVTVYIVRFKVIAIDLLHMHLVFRQSPD